MTNVMLARLGVIYGPPASTDPVAYLAEMAKMLDGYADRVLEAAADLVLKTHRGRQWPTPAECVTACADVLDRENSEKRRAPQAERYPDWTDEAIKKANKLIQSDLGRQAAREGWVMSLWDYCRAAGMLPATASAIHRCKVSAQEFDEAYRSVCRGEGNPGLDAALRGLGDTMLARREKIALLALGEAA